MTGEELDKLINGISAEIEKLVDDPEKPLGRRDRRRRAILRARKDALERVRAAAAEGNFGKETQANLDYSLLTEYAEKHPLLFNLMRSQFGWRYWL